MKILRVFLDTEFSDFVDPDLISIALVTEDGRQFYAERSDFARARSSAFVAEAVLPQLGKQLGQVMTLPELRVRLGAWLQEILDGGDCVVICYDYFLDRDCC